MWKTYWYTFIAATIGVVMMPVVMQVITDPYPAMFTVGGLCVFAAKMTTWLESKTKNFFEKKKKNAS